MVNTIPETVRSAIKKLITTHAGTDIIFENLEKLCDIDDSH